MTEKTEDQLAAEKAAAEAAEKAAAEAAEKAAAEAAEKAAAEAAEKAAAEAAEKAAAEAAEKATAEAAAPDPKPEKWRAAIARIEELNNKLHRDALLDELETQMGALTSVPLPGTDYAIRLFGIEGASPMGWEQALNAWCSKARRACMNGGAV